MRISFHPEAADEAIGVRFWYEQVSASLGRDFQEVFDLTVGRILNNPNSWPKGMRGTRFLTMERIPYLLVYRHQEEDVKVIAVAHTRRKPGYWKRRLS